MNKNKVLITVIATVVLSSVMIIGAKTINKNNNDESKAKVEQMLEENSNNFVNVNDNKDKEELEYDLDKALDDVKKDSLINSSDIVVEKGFKTSIANGSTDEELIEKNLLVKESKFSINERIKAKNVAENFVQAIESFDIEKPQETIDLAVKNVADELKQEVEALYIHLGKNQDIKKKTISKVESYEVANKYDNDYIIFEVWAYWDVVDKYDQVSNSGMESYEVTLLKINNQYKVTSYRIT